MMSASYQLVRLCKKAIGKPYDLVSVTDGLKADPASFLRRMVCWTLLQAETVNCASNAIRSALRATLS